MLSLLLFPFVFCLCRLHQRTIHTNQFHTPSHHVGHMQLLHQVRFLCVLAWCYCSCICLLSNVPSVGFSDQGHIWNWLLLPEHTLGTGFYLFFHDSWIDKKRNILTSFSNIHKNNSQSCSDDKIFNFMGGVVHVEQDKGFGFVITFGQGSGFGLTSLTCCCRTQLGIGSAMALN